MRTYTPELLDHVGEAMRTYVLLSEQDDPFAARSRTVYRVCRRFDANVVEFSSHDFDEANRQFWRLSARATLDAYHEEVEHDAAAAGG